MQSMFISESDCRDMDFFMRYRSTKCVACDGTYDLTNSSVCYCTSEAALSIDEWECAIPIPG